MMKTEKISVTDFLLNASALRKVYVTLLFMSSICLVDRVFYLLAFPVSIWAGAFIVLDITGKKKLLNIKYKQLVFAFIFSSLISVIIHAENNFINNVCFVYQMSVCLILFYGMHSHCSHSKLKKEMFSLFSFLLNLTNFFVILSLILLFVCKDGFTIFNYYFCIKDNRFVGLFINSNLLAFYCVTAVIMCHILYVHKKNSSVKIHKHEYAYFICSFAINILALFLSDSNGGLLLLVSYASIYVIQHIVSRSIHLGLKILLKRIAVLAILLIILCCGFIMCRIGFQQGVSEIVSSSSSDISFNHLNQNIDSGRLDLYSEGIYLFLKAPIFGIGKANIVTYGDIYLGGLRFSDLHNGFLTLLVSTGIVGFNIFMILGYTLLKGMLPHMIKKREDVFPCLVSFILAYCVYSMIEVTLVFSVSYTVLMFWLVLGYAVSYMIKYEKVADTAKIKHISLHLGSTIPSRVRIKSKLKIISEVTVSPISRNCIEFYQVK